MRLILSFNFLFFIVSAIIAVAYTVYNYRFTLPPLSAPKKTLLIFLRTSAFFLLLLVIFEPILVLENKKTIEPTNLIFLDKSKSMTFVDGFKRDSTLKLVAERIRKSSIADNAKFFTFGDSITEIKKDSLQKMSLTAPETNFARIFNSIDSKEQNISSITIISDGVITDGVNPLYSAEKINIPVFTLGLGDSSKRNDVVLQSVYHNDYAYAGISTSFVGSIEVRGFSGKSVTIEMFEDNSLLLSKQIILQEEGMNSVPMEYLPKVPGEKKIVVKISPLEGEFSTANNAFAFYITVLNNQIKALILAGAPSSDISFLKTTLTEDTNLTVRSYIQAGKESFLEGNFDQKVADSADVLFLINFPSSNTPSSLIDYVKSKIKQQDKPFFFLLSNSTDLEKLKLLSDELPFTITRVFGSMNEVYAVVGETESRNPILQNAAKDVIAAWNELPPVFRPDWEIKLKPEAKAPVKIKVNNVKLDFPLIITKKFASQRGIAIIASDIWKWKLVKAPLGSDLYSKFIHNSLRWLNARNDKKQVAINTSKKFYGKGEKIEFFGEIYDASFNPVSDAIVKVSISSAEKKDQIILTHAGGGIYEGFYKTSATGDMFYTAEAFLDKELLGTDASRFNIGDVDLEMVNPTTDAANLALLSKQTNGRFFYNSNYPEMIKMLEDLNQKARKEKITSTETALWSNNFMLYAIVLLFAFEWFARKRWGLI